MAIVAVNLSFAIENCLLTGFNFNTLALYRLKVVITRFYDACFFHFVVHKQCVFKSTVIFGPSDPVPFWKVLPTMFCGKEYFYNVDNIVWLCLSQGRRYVTKGCSCATGQAFVLRTNTNATVTAIVFTGKTRTTLHVVSGSIHDRLFFNFPPSPV